jgi:hypothetical protein
MVVDRIARRQILVMSSKPALVAMPIFALWTGLPPAAMIGLFAVLAGALSAASSLVYVCLPELFQTDPAGSPAFRLAVGCDHASVPEALAAYSIRALLLRASGYQRSTPCATGWHRTR